MHTGAPSMEKGSSRRDASDDVRHTEDEYVAVCLNEVVCVVSRVQSILLR